jgi:chromate transporter
MNTQHPTFREAFLFWLKLGFISFGGPAGQIAIMHREVVEKRRWVGEAHFLHALNFCMLLPGPEAQQLAIYLGWLLHKTWGGIVAGVLFVLPSALILWALSYVYVAFGDVAWIAGIFAGLKPAVLAIVIAAVLRIGGKALKNEVMWSLAALAFAAIFFFHVPFPIIVAAAGIVGFLGGKVRREKFLVIKGHGESAVAPAMHAAPTIGRAVKVTAFCLALWWLPVLGIGAWLGWSGTHFQQGMFFSKAAMVTFGGAYAVLPYVAQDAVQTHGWLTAPQMLDGLGLAETTPGPLIMVLQFVGFLGGWNHPGTLSPLASATLGAAITTWTTFVPCFLWIFLGAPYVERLRNNESLSCALSAITAAVVGVILNLALWFGLQVLFPAAWKPDWLAIGIAIVAFVGMHRLKWSVIAVVLGAGLLGAVMKLAA